MQLFEDVFAGRNIGPVITPQEYIKQRDARSSNGRRGRQMKAASLFCNIPPSAPAFALLQSLVV